MDKFEYKVVKLKYSQWTGKVETDYLEILNEYGEQGWRFIDFAPIHLANKESKGNYEMIFERKIVG